MQIPRIVQMHDHRVIGRPPLDLEYLANGGRIGGIRAEPVNGLGRKHHQIACAQRFDGFLDFSLCSSYHSPMISRLRGQQWTLRMRVVQLCRNAGFRGGLFGDEIKQDGRNLQSVGVDTVHDGFFSQGSSARKALSFGDFEAKSAPLRR